MLNGIQLPKRRILNYLRYTQLRRGASEGYESPTSPPDISSGLVKMTHKVLKSQYNRCSPFSLDDPIFSKTAIEYLSQIVQ